MFKRMVPKGIMVASLAIGISFFGGSITVNAIQNGGGYAITSQLEGVGYSSTLYDADNGLPTSDANYILSDKNGNIWIGGYAGIVQYDGNNFERLDSSDGLTSGRTIFQDSKGRIWFGTNDNGIVLKDGDEFTRYTYKEGLPASMIRSFEEDSNGNIYVATTDGVCVIGEDLVLKNIEHSSLDNAYIIRLSGDGKGNIYGNTRNGEIFLIKKGSLETFINGEDLGLGNVTAIFADEKNPGKVYIGNDAGQVFYGEFGQDAEELETIDVSPAIHVNWISRACGRIWIIAENIVGYLDEEGNYRVLEDIPVDSGIEMLTEDFQGNLWLASSRQGVAKIVTNNFHNLTAQAGLEEDVVNATCLLDNQLYIGMDKGLKIIDENGDAVTNSLTEYLDGTRVRCITRDNDGNLWISCYTNGKGLVRYSSDGQIQSYNEENGFISNGVRTAILASDGSIIVGTNAGVAIMKDGQMTDTYGIEEGLENTVCLNLSEGPNGQIAVGTDGGGLSIIEGSKITNYNRDEGLTADVILRVKWDDARQLYWIVTSNSIQYMKNGVIYQVNEFPYSNNFDIYFDSNGNAWVLSSDGIYCLNADDMVNNAALDYQLYDSKSGLSSTPTSNSFCELDEEGNLYIAERTGVDKVNINNFFQQNSEIRLGLNDITCNDQEILPNEEGVYVLPADAGRIQINANVLNYTLSNPSIRMYLEGYEGEGITVYQSNLAPLEYTGLTYGQYKLHIQLVDEATGEAYQDNVYAIEKKPHFMELMLVKVLLLLLLAFVAGFIVWRILSGTIIRRQYKEIAAAKAEAERASTAKSRFLANMSHEIRTPINTIMGMDEMILREDTTDVPKDYSNSMTSYAFDIRTAAESLLELINDILDISKIESGKMNLVEIEYSPEELIRGMITMIRIKSDEKDLNFDIDIDENIPSRLYGDMGKIKQIVINLLTNAVKYTKEGGFSLRVSVMEKDEESCKLLFGVKDSGIGVKPEDMAKLFSAFERLEEQKNNHIQGTGLGLDISRQFAGLMNGTLECESEYGKGSDFTFVVEQKIVNAVPIGKFEEEKIVRIRESYKPKFVAPDAAVLIVDDNKINLNVMKGLLSATKMFISTAQSGEECLDKLKTGTFNLVFLDYLMPGMDGVETLHQIRRRFPDLPVYALTANIEPEGEQFYTSRGFNGYFAKPIDTDMLESTILKNLPEDIVQIL